MNSERKKFTCKMNINGKYFPAATVKSSVGRDWVGSRSWLASVEGSFVAEAKDEKHSNPSATRCLFDFKTKHSSTVAQ
jgi:hypothetical protein